MITVICVQHFEPFFCIQSLIELSDQGSEERALLESLSNHLGAKSAKADTTRPLAFGDEVDA